MQSLFGKLIKTCVFLSYVLLASLVVANTKMMEISKLSKNVGDSMKAWALCTDISPCADAALALSRESNPAHVFL